MEFGINLFAERGSFEQNRAIGVVHALTDPAYFRSGECFRILRGNLVTIGDEVVDLFETAEAHECLEFVHLRV